MSTTSTVPTVIDAYLAAVNTDLTGVTAYEVWPGPESSREMVVLGDINWTEAEFPVVTNASRIHRDELYTIDFSIWVIGGSGDTPADPSETRDRAFEIMESLENVLAADATAGTDYQTVSWAKHNAETAAAAQFEWGWAYVITGNIAVKARLQ